MAAGIDKQSFWDHLDVLRAAIVKSLLVAVVFGVAAFCFKEELFAVILAPKDAGFITYRLLYSISGLVTDTEAPDFLVKQPIWRPGVSGWHKPIAEQNAHHSLEYPCLLQYHR